jgi:hypothetical protein
MKLDQIIITSQQEAGLAAFRAEQEERDNLKDCDFLGFYTMWQYEQGYFSDHNLIADKFNFVEGD